MRISLSDSFTYPKLIRFIMPSVMMMIFTSIYCVVDGFFVSNYVGKIPFAALNLIYPFIAIMGGIGFMIGTGGNALVSKTLGEKKEELANQYFSMLILFTILTGIILSSIGIAVLKPVSILLGATEEMLPHCITYGTYMLLFNTAFMLQYCFQSFLITAEKPKLGLYFTILAGCTNMVLDLVLVGFLNYGLSGAAIASGMSQCIGGILPLIYFCKKNDSLLHFKMTKLVWKPIMQACYNGMSEFLSNISNNVVAMIFNFQLIHYLGDDGVAAFGVIMYLNFVFIAIFLGYSIGVAPVIGYNYGANNHKELKSLLRKSLTLIFTSGICMCLLAVGFTDFFVKIFVSYDPTLFNITVHGLQLYSYSFILCGINIFASSFFTALSNGKISAIISSVRILVFQLACVIILPLLIGVDGIWLAVGVAELLSLFVSLMYLKANQPIYHY